MPRHTQPNDRLTIGSKDSATLLEVVAQYNPKELSFNKAVPWAQQAENIGDYRTSSGFALNYGGDGPRTLNLELTFDTYETSKNGMTGDSVEDDVDVLQELASPIDPSEQFDESKRRAHICILVWGKQQRFVAVIESLATKYTMFFPDGTPCRAVCSVSFKEVDYKAMAQLSPEATKLNMRREVERYERERNAGGR